MDFAKMVRLALAVVLITLPPAASADAMTSEQKAAFYKHFHDQLARCFVQPMAKTGMAQVEIRLNPDGSLFRPPKLVAAPSDPGMGQAALRAVNRCAPFDIPSAFKSSYGEWKHLQVYFDF